ncbi:uncharacterized protein T069G_10563 [Trichoderma breve]|uniref:Uncharacterized protein n=1 Tax=Trichoderma breve TaxID=2034170 RepID=A0A9W9E2Z2_9HYPO|nr:uncharacterized protein T069G_10563 [Trichoderma breve]KAJ4855005.1 hypothetical protein T069G_10563 [Trichoderma breve]
MLRPQLSMTTFTRNVCFGANLPRERSESRGGGHGIFPFQYGPYGDEIDASHDTFSLEKTTPGVRNIGDIRQTDFRTNRGQPNAFTSSESLMKIHLSIPHHSILKLAGVDPTNPDRDAALEILDDELGSSVSDVMRLAKFLQLRKVPSSWLPRGAEKLAKVVNALRVGEMEPLMRDHLETRGYAVGIDPEPPLSRGRKRRLDSE